ncbi:hypothetical protein [Herbidospora sp. NBRC 101105]|uniref:hypothetical protein n=1 Tax=Herbidospora sp. NBRC 101105 TaxID=3032195 RepID=UPI0024A1CF89|nr:hypothetical protein [Herbidospora sp. NBRC 101105]GLX98555.1 hypothetical protein Hesp01_65050 [Herbidospora sp. NBRC 101105]
MSILSKVVLATTSIVTGIVTLTAVTQPASAAIDTLYNGADRATFNDATGTFTVCDNENDGHRVYVYAKKLDGSETSKMYDPDSYGGGCGGGTIGRGRWNTWHFCEDIPAWPDDCASSGLTYE